MKLSSGNVFNLKRGEIRVFYGEITLDHDDTIRAWISCPGKAECLSVEGHDFLGGWFDKLDKKATAGVAKKLWFYVKAPDKAGKYNGTITVTTTARKVLANLAISLNVSEEIFEGDAFGDASDLSRLFWLNSELGINSEVPKPFMPVCFDGKRVKILGRELELDEYGLPKRITSHFDKNGNISDESYEILSEKLKFTVGDESFKIISSGALCHEDYFSFSSISESDGFMMKTRATIEFDGFCSYKITLIAKRDAKLSNVNLCLPISECSRKYFAGLGSIGGAFSGELNFKWDKAKNQDSFFAGCDNGGIRVKFKDENYKKPATGEFYARKPLNMPKSWDNFGRGGIVYENACFNAYSGECEFSYGEKRSFDFELLITPTKPKASAKTPQIEIPCGHALNPLLNYPLANEEALSSFIKSAHEKGERASISYTLGELDKSAPEFSAFSDFDEELLLKGDLMAICDGESRLCNFYVEALKRLVEMCQIDGITLNGAEFDRNTAKRIRRVLDGREGATISLNIENQFTKEAGFASAIVEFAELFPYIDKIEISDESTIPTSVFGI